MPDFEVDLTNCDREPIHIPGQVQSHGFLLVTDKAGIIRFYSENVTQYLGESVGNPLGRHIACIEPFIDNIPQSGFISQLLLLGTSAGYEQINPFQVSIGGQGFFLIISSLKDCHLLEFEPGSSTVDLDVQKMIGKSVAEMLADKNMQSLLNNTALQVKSIIQYDRVMVYRFAEDGHGEVVAEARNEELESWLGLHYPASDIPKQARELYKLNLTRLIADVEAVPSKIFTDPGRPGALDLTYSQLRAVSPIHIQYLKNTGVASSFSISLIYKGELWGLVACHSYTQRFIDYKSRESAKLIGQILSSALEFRQDEENQQVQDTFKNKLEQLSKQLQQNDDIAFALTQEPVNILDLTHAAGAALVYENEITLLGLTPDKTQVNGLLKWYKQNIAENLYSTTNLSGIFPEASAYQHLAGGVMVSVLSKELGEYMIWFKPERLQTIKWAGNPEKPVEINEHGLQHISPRHSFKVWLQNVRGVSDAWHPEENNSALRLKEELNYALNLKAGALRLLNEKLRAAYEELDTFSYTISHDLKNPIAAIKGYTQLLNRTAALGQREQTMVNKIADQADKMNFMINEVLNYSRVGRQDLELRTVNAGNLIGDVVNDLELIYTSQNLQITVGNTPDVKGEPLMLLQVFSNLIGNAVKYSQSSEPSMVGIEGTESEQEVCYTVRDNGLGIAQDDIPNVFHLFNRMKNVSHIDGSGVGLAIVKRIIEKHKGRIWVESELGKGSAFYIAFNK